MKLKLSLDSYITNREWAKIDGEIFCTFWINIKNTTK
jgi:hypothetical protein